jgi:hypothetical protein
MTEIGRVVVLMAMEPEVAAVRARMGNVRQSTEHGVQLTRGELAGQPITAVLSCTG